VAANADHRPLVAHSAPSQPLPPLTHYALHQPTNDALNYSDQCGDAA